MSTSNMTSLDEHHLARAIVLAGEAGQNGNRPFGAVLVAGDGSVIAEGRNEGTSSGDITAHAELAAIRAADAPTTGATMYASGEPCPMCAAAMVWAGLARIVFAASEPAFSEILPAGTRFGLRCAEVVASAHVSITVDGPFLETEALEVMRG
ncbi:MAG: nucleoside deaminase [Rhodococcus sp. (in: high G+C Gram-positive bacteria)]